MTSTYRDWLQIVLQHCCIGSVGRVRLQDFSDIRARIEWASRSEPQKVRVERFVLDPRWPKGRLSELRVHDSFLKSEVPDGLPKEWLPVFQGDRFMHEVRKHSREREWWRFISVPIILGYHMLGSLSLEARIELIEMLSATKADGDFCRSK